MIDKRTAISIMQEEVKPNIKKLSIDKPDKER